MMPCYRPIKGYRARVPNENKKYPIVFSPREGMIDQPVDLPCGQCIGCRLERSRQWAVRCTHEASLYESNCFITLTYSDEHLPRKGCVDDFGNWVDTGPGQLVLDHFQNFMKRLRQRCAEARERWIDDDTPGDEPDAWMGKFVNGVRFFHCGEYGEKFGRPHYHACLFNFDFEDKFEWRQTEGGEQVWRSPTLEKLWPFGVSEIGSVTFESAAYVARYITKKITGAAAETHYDGRKPEYTTMSRRPGIGKAWFDLYKGDVFPADELVLRGKMMKPPKYYDRRFELDSPEAFGKVKANRKDSAEEKAQNEPWYRLAVREQCHEISARQLKRGMENEI